MHEDWVRGRSLGTPAPPGGQTMDLTSIEAVERPEGDAAIAARMGCFGDGDAWLAGGTWLFSEPQPQLRRLIDLAAAGWLPISADAEGYP